MVQKKTRKIKKLCYVIMPFSDYIGIKEDEWTDVYENIFRPAIEGSGFGYRCERSEISAGAFTKEIVENMKNAHVVLADITGFNGNVMWELGVRHALSPRTIMVARDKILDTKIISDLKIYGVHTYENNAGGIKRFKQEIKKSLKKIEENPDKSDNPVFDFLKVEDLVLSSFERKQISNKLTGLINELLENLRIAEGIIDKELKVTENSVTYYRFQHFAIQYYLTNNYVTVNTAFEKYLHVNFTYIHETNVALHTLSDTIKDPNYSLEQNKQYVKLIFKNSKIIKTEMKERIQELTSCLNSLHKGSEIKTDAVIFYHKAEHQKIIQSK